jgi:energy-coupling factor transporter ATP-binding protein EcfA2
MGNKGHRYCNEMAKRRRSMIKELFLKNFRGIRTGKLEDFAQFTILVGPNNSGKTTILEALYLLFSTTPGEIYHEGNFIPCLMPEKDFLGYDPLRRLQEKHGILTWKGNPGKFVEGSIKVGIKEEYWDLQRPDDNFKVGDEDKIGYVTLDYTRKGLDSDAKSNEKKWLEIIVNEEDLKNFPDKGRTGVLWFQDFAYETQNTAVWTAGVDRNPYEVLFFDVVAAMRHIKTDFYVRASKSVPGWLHDIRERFGSIFPNGDFQIAFTSLNNPNDMKASIEYREKPQISVDLLGDGARTMFKFLVFLTALKDNGLVLWEDPELFQHSETLERSLTEVVDIAKKKNMQIFLSTQSLEVLGLFATMVKEGNLPSEDVQAYYTDLKEGILRYRPFTGENVAEWLEMELDPRKKRELTGKLIYRMGEEE